MERVRLQEVDCEYYHGMLPCGLRFCVVPRPGFRRTFAILGPRYGSVDNAFYGPHGDGPYMVPAGIAHFLEHKMFEKPTGHMFRRFAAAGAMCDAYTSYTYTGYVLSTAGDWRVPLRLLVELVFDLHLTRETVEKEKGIIEQEIRMVEDDPDTRAFEELMRCLYHRHPVRVPIAGTVADVRSLGVEQIELCHRTFYHPSNMWLSVAGPVDPQEVTELVQELLEARGYRPQEPVRRLLPQEPEGVVRPQQTVRMSVGQPLCYLGFKDVPSTEQGESLWDQLAAVSIALDATLGPASDLYLSLYQEGLIDDTFQAHYEGEQSYAHLVIGASTPDPARLSDRLREGLQRAVERGIDEGTFRRCIKAARGRFLRRLDPPFGPLARLVFAFRHRGTDPMRALDRLAALDISQVSSALRRLVSRPLAAVWVLPRQREAGAGPDAGSGFSGGSWA